MLHPLSEGGKVKVKNTSKNSYCHAKLDDNYKLKMLILAPNEIKDIPDEIAKSWLKSGEVVEFVEPKEAKKLADENEALKKELEKLKSQPKDVKKVDKKDKKSTKKSTTKKNK